MSSVVNLTDQTKNRIKRVALASLGALTLSIIALSIWLYRLDKQITNRLEQGRFAPAIEFYTAPEAIQPGHVLPSGYLESFFHRRRFKQKNFGSPLQSGEFAVWNGDECVTVLPPLPPDPFALTSTSTSNLTPTPNPTPTPPTDGAVTAATEAETGDELVTSASPQDDPLAVPPPEVGKCVAFTNLKPLPNSNSADEESLQIVVFKKDNRSVAATFTGESPQLADQVVLEPELFAQYYGDSPILREEVPLANAPANCLNALVAIEDAQFLEHRGVNPVSLLRAFFSIVRNRRVTQGGSTLTQQLVKNFFLTDERTLKRKINEIGMALLLEGRLNKDQILELYINTIYMGQNGVFQVRGFGSAAQHYFGLDLQDLDLPQCALTAAIVNGPGVFDPFTKPQNAFKRRNHVLERMRELGYINDEDLKASLITPLPSRPKRGLTEPAPYFVQTVRRQLAERGLDEAEGLRVYTTLNLRAQEAAYQAVNAGLERLETKNAYIKKIKTKGKNLEAILLSSNPATGHVQALIGGRGFKKSPYNRAFDSRRQVGSVMKPFVYLAALEKSDESGQPYTPISLLRDEQFTHKYQGQKWSPRNYDGKFNGEIPMYFALKESLNAGTAWLGLHAGLSDIVDIARRLGIKSKMDALPSLTLGAFELHPWEVLQSYGALARLGELAPLTFLIRVEDLGGDVLFEQGNKREQVVSPEAAASLVSMMKQTLLSGTARGVRLSGFTHPAGGKTGTTNDKKDAWFAGFTPLHAAVVWVGYDDNTPHTLTGSSGAVPIWTHYMKAYGSSLPPVDFKWPESTENALLSPEQQAALGVPESTRTPLEPIELVFRKGLAPKAPVDSWPDAAPTPNMFKPGGI